MTKPMSMEQMVVKYTKIIHPKDLGKSTNKLEHALREALEEAHRIGWNEGFEDCLTSEKYRKKIINL